MDESLRAVLDATRDFLRAWPRLLVTDLLFKLLAFTVLTPLVGLALAGFVALSGGSVVADQDILYFVLSPIGLVALVTVGAAALAILALEQAGLMTIGYGMIRGTHVSVREALQTTLSRVGSILILTGALVVRVLVLAAPFLVVAGIVYGLLLTEFDINYYLSERPPAFWIAGVGIAGIVAVLVLVLVPRIVGWAYALPLLLFENVAPLDAFRASAERTRGRRKMLMATLVGWAVTATLLSAVALGLVRAVGVSVVPGFRDSIAELVVVLGGIVALWSVVNLFVTLFQASTFALLTVRLYEESASESATMPGNVSRSDVLRISSGKLVLALAGASAVAAGLVYATLHGITLEDDVLVIAHRGAAGRAPENTLAAVEAAIEDGADFVEIDVQETRDGRVVVLHDSDFMKIARVGTKIWDVTFDEAREIDIGSWFAPEFAAERIPTLEEVLRVSKGRAKVDIELKYYGHDLRLEERVVEIVERTDTVDDIVIMSLAQTGIQKVRALRPSWTVGLLMARTISNPTRLDADFLAVHTGLATDRFVDRAHAAGKDVYVWTVNDPLTMTRMMSRGVDGIITDEPALARRVLAERAEMTSVERLLLEAALWMGVTPRDPGPKRDAPLDTSSSR